MSLRCTLVDASGAGSGGVCGAGDCARLVETIGDPRETCGPRIDSIPQARPTTSTPRIKKLPFLPPSKCLIDLFGPVSNRTILKQMHVACSSRSQKQLHGFPSSEPSKKNRISAAAFVISIKADCSQRINRQRCKSCTHEPRTARLIGVVQHKAIS